MTRSRRDAGRKGKQMIDLIIENEQDKEELTPEIEKRRVRGGNGYGGVRV